VSRVELVDRAVTLLLPDLKVVETIAPPARPDSALGTLVSTLNSAMASGLGKIPICPNCDSLLSTPSRVEVVVRNPLAVGRED